MRRRGIISLALLLVCASVPATASAQDRTGLWGGFGAGWGIAEIQADGLGDQDRANSGVVYFDAGWTINPQFLVGAEFDMWRKSTELNRGIEANFNIYNLSGTLTFYGGPTSRLFFKVGAGMSFLDVDYDVQRADIQLDLGSGFGFILGAGYDIPLTRGISFTPAANLWYGQVGDVNFGNRTLFTDWKQNVFDLTIGLKFH